MPRLENVVKGSNFRTRNHIGRLEGVPQQMAADRSARTIGMSDRRLDDISVNEVERILI
jgi:hypothetical protein